MPPERESRADEDAELSADRARGAPAKVIRRLENGELFRHRADDELVQRCAIFPSDFLNGPLEGGR